jgi:L-fucose isomerase-like protein
VASFAYLSVSSALHDQSSVERILDDLAGDLRAAGGQPTTDQEADSPFAVVVLTGGTEQRVLRAAASRTPGEPMIVVAHPFHNSLPAALEAVARLHQDGRPARIVFLDGREPAVEQLAKAAADVAVARTLRNYTIGLLGAPSDWLVASSPEPRTVRESWGPRVVRVDIDEVLAGYEHSSHHLTTDAVSAATLVHPVLMDLVRRHHLDALTIRCFDLVQRFGTSGCLALAALNDAGVMAGCEGDLPSLIGMIWTKLLLGETPWMANPAQVGLDSEEILLAHCTIAPSLTTGYEITTHFESGQGAALAGALPAGPVTLVRLGGRDLRRYWVVEGESVPTVPREGLCRTQLTVRLRRQYIEELLTTPLGNHIVLVRGHHRDRLLGWLAATRVPTAG